MTEEREKQTTEEFRQFFTRFLKDHGKDPDLAPELMLDSALLAFEAVKKVKLDLSDDEKKMFEGLVADPERVKSKEKILGGLVESARAEVGKLGSDRRRSEECRERVKNVKEECWRALGEEHPLTKKASELLLGVQNTIAELDKEAEETVDDAISYETAQAEEYAQKAGIAVEKKDTSETVMDKIQEQASVTEENILAEERRIAEEVARVQKEAEEVAQSQVEGLTVKLQEEESVFQEPEAEQSRAEKIEYIERLKQDLVDLQKELADSFAEKEKKSGLWGKITGGKEKSEAKYEHYLAMYKDTKEKLIEAEEMQLSEAMRFLQSKEKELRAEIKEKYGAEKENIVSKAWRKMGDCNVYNLFEKKSKENPDSWWGREFKKWGVAGKVGGKMLSLRFGISMGLAGLGIHGPGMATQSEAFILSRSGMVGLGSGFGSRDIMDRAGRWIGDRKLKKVKDVSELGETPQEQYGKLSELIEEYEGYAMVNKVDLSKNDDYARLLGLRGQVEEKLIEQRRELIGEGDVNKLLEFLNNQEADGLDNLSQKIGKAKTKRWIKRGVSITFGAAIGVFTQMCLTAKAAKEQASQAYFAWVEEKQKALEAAQEAQTHAQSAVEHAGATPVADAPPKITSEFKIPVAEHPVSVKSSGLGAVAETVVTPKTEALDLSKLVKDSDLGKFFTDSHLAKAEFNYLQKLTEQYPELKNQETIKEILKAAEFHDGKASAVADVYKGAINTPIEAAANSKMLILEKILNSQKPDSVDRALDFLQRQNFNAHSLENMGIKGSAGLAEKMRAVLADFQEGDKKAGKLIFDALRHDQNRAIAPFEDAKGIVRIRGVGGDPRVLGADEFDKDKLLVGQAKGYVKGGAWQPPEITTEDVENVEKHVDLDFQKAAIDEKPTISVSEDMSERLKIKPSGYREIIKQPNGKTIEYHVDGGEVTAYDITPDLASAASAGVDAQTGAGEAAVRAASVAHNAPRPVPISELWNPSGSSSVGASHGGGGGAGSGGSASSGGGVGIKPETAMVKGGGVVKTVEAKVEAPVTKTPSSAIISEGESKDDALFTKTKVEKNAVSDVGKKDAPAHTESDVASKGETPEAVNESFLPETASFEDMEKAIDGSDWKSGEENQALTCLRMLEMQDGLTKNGANNLSELFTEKGIADGDTQAEANWRQHIVSLLNQKQGDSLRVLREGLNKGTDWTELKKQLSQEMFLYDLAMQQETSSSIEFNDANFFHYKNWAGQRLQEWYDNSDTEGAIAREKVGLGGGGTASQ